MEQGSVAPARSYEQRMNALRRANDVRSSRRRLKERMRRGEVGPGEVLASGHPDLATMKVWDVLMATPKIGRTKAHKTFVRAKISPSKTVGGLSERQRRELQPVLRRYQPVGSAAQAR